MKSCAIVLGAGSGKRMGAEINKIFLPLMGVPVIVRAVAPFTGFCEQIVVTAAADEVQTMRQILSRYGLKNVRVIPGGRERQDSVWNALQSLPGEEDLVLIHDGARALVTEDIIRAAMESASEKGSGIASIPVTDTIKRADLSGRVIENLCRSELYAMQTPQAFRCRLILKAHEAARQKQIYATDDAALLSLIGEEAFLSPGSPENLKLTTPMDLSLAELILEKRSRKENSL